MGVFAEIAKTTLDEVPTADTGFQGKIESSMWVFIDDAHFTEQDLNCFKEEFRDYLTEQKLYGIVQFILLKPVINFLQHCNSAPIPFLRKKSPHLEYLLIQPACLYDN